MKMAYTQRKDKMKVKLSFLILWLLLTLVISSCLKTYENPKGYYYYTNGKQIFDTNQLEFLINEENYEELTSDFQPKMFQTKTTLNQKWLLAFNKVMIDYRKKVYNEYRQQFPDKIKLIDSLKSIGTVSNCLLFVLNNETKEVEHFSLNGRINKNFEDIEIRNSKLLGTLAAFENGKDLSDNCYNELVKVRKNRGITRICPNKTLENYFNYGSTGASICYPPYSYLDWFEILKSNENLRSRINVYTLKTNYNLSAIVTTDVYAELNLFKSLRNNRKVFIPRVLYNVKKTDDKKLYFKKSSLDKMESLLNKYMVTGNGRFCYVNDYLNGDSWCVNKAINVFENVMIYSSEKYTVLLVENSHLRFSTSFFLNRKYNLVYLLNQIFKELKIDQKKGEMSLKAKKYQKELEKSDAFQF